MVMRNFLCLSLFYFLALSTGLAQSSLNQPLWQLAQNSEPDVLRTLEKIVNIESGTGYETGLNQVSQWLVTELRALGATVEIKPALTNGGNNVIATFTGSGHGRVLLLAHMDTVFKEGTLRERPFKVDNGRLYGPGIADDKGGVAVGLQALRILHQIGFTNYERITLVLNPDEEKGSLGSHDLISELARQHDVALTLEPGVPGDGVMKARKGIGYYKIRITGKAAHAGIRPEAGRNAAVELAHQVLQLGQLGDPSKGTTVNFTILNAGERANVIPDYAFGQADVRVCDPAEFDRLERDFYRLAKEKLIPDTEVKVEPLRGRPPFPADKGSERLAAQAVAIYKELDKTLNINTSGGGSDANYAAAAGIPALDGLGLVGGNDHEPTEYAELASIGPRVYLLTRMLMECCAR